MHDNKNKYTFRKHKAYGLVGAMFATALMATPGALSQIPVLGNLIGESGEVHAANVEVSRRTLTDTPPIQWVYEADPNYTLRAMYTESEPKNGSRTWVTWRDTETGRTWEAEWGTVVLPEEGVKRVGTKPTVTNEEIRPTEKRYVKDPERVRGSEDITVPGENGINKVTQYYTVNRSNGTVSEGDRDVEKVKDPTPTIVKVAAKDKVETLQRGRQTVENQNEIHKTNRTIGFLFYLNEHPNPPITQFQTLLK